MKAYELFTELSSENRLAILQILDEKPMTFTSIIKEIDMNSAEASRQLSRLTEAQLIEKKGDGRYYNTPFGKLVLSSISDLNFISERSGYFLNHDTSQIPLEPCLMIFQDINCPILKRNWKKERNSEEYFQKTSPRCSVKKTGKR